MVPPRRIRPTSTGPLRRRYKAMEELEASAFVVGRWQRVVAVVLTALGVVVGCMSLPLLSNAYGNTAAQGFVLLAIASGIIGVGVSLHSYRFSTALGIGILALPLGPLLAFVLFWGAIVFMALFGWLLER